MMNKPTLLTLLTALAALPVTGLIAQTPAAPAATPSVSAPAATPSVSAPATTHAADAEEQNGVKAAMKVLTPEERHRLQAANRVAMQDPAVQAAKAHRDTPQEKRAFREARRAAILRADPSVGPLIEKVKEANRLNKGKGLKN